MCRSEIGASCGAVQAHAYSGIDPLCELSSDSCRHVRIYPLFPENASVSRGLTHHLRRIQSKHPKGGHKGNKVSVMNTDMTCT